MKRVGIFLFLLFFLLSFSASSTRAGEYYFSGWMSGSGRQHFIWEDRGQIELWKSLRPLIWGGALYLGACTVEKLFLIPTEIEMKKAQIEITKRRAEAEVERFRKETEFRYNKGDWRSTPRGYQWSYQWSLEKYFFEK